VMDRENPILFVANIISAFILVLAIGITIGKCTYDRDAGPIKIVEKDKILIQCKDGSTEWFDLPKCEVKP
jgi:hypothetical protein